MNLTHPLSCARALVVLATAAALLSSRSAQAAGPFTVNNTGDTHVANTNTGADSNGHVTLRSAIEAANSNSSPTTINVPAGIYNLSLGELAIAPKGSATNIIQASGGATNSNTIISQTDGTNRVFNIDKNSGGQTVVTLSGFTIQGGHDVLDSLGGAGVLAGSVTNASLDALTLNGCVVQNNHCAQPSANYTANPGGGVQMAGGNLMVNNCVFSNNSSSAAFGGGLFFYNPSVTATLTVSNSLFINNGMTNNSASGPDGGGAIMIGSTSNSVHFIAGTAFLGNQALGSVGNAEGGAVQMNTGTLNITSATFSNNAATGPIGLGGALYGDAGTFNLSYCRILSNSASQGGSAVYIHDANGASATVDNNWWDTNGSPSATILAGAATTAYLQLLANANPSLFPKNTSTLITATFLTNSAGATIAASNLGALVGLPVTFGNAVKGTISGAQPVIQPSGTATATFTAGSVAGPASATATVDNVPATALFEIQCPTIAGSVGSGSTICAGNSATVSVSLSGGIGPYTVTLNNGGGTATNASPVVLTVSPSATTTYSVATALDSEGCPATVTGSATVTVDSLPTASITPSPTSVCSGSSGNQAIGPAGMSGYSWTVANGSIVNGGHSQTLTYAAGVSGSVTLGLTVTNSSGCSATTSTQVTINPLPYASISPLPTMVGANTPGNQASGPAGVSSYAWTILNGEITSATNLQTITYVSGKEGSVTLQLTVFNASGCPASVSAIVPIIQEPGTPSGWSFRTNYFNSFTFTDALPAAPATMTLAFDGTNYWSAGGGNTIAGCARYDTNGVLISTNNAGLDFRSVFTDANGTVLARAYSSGVIYEQTSPGLFVPSGVTLTGGTLDPQASVAMNGAGTEYVAMLDGAVSQWDPDGNFLSTLTLQGYGSLTGETAGSVPARGIAAFGNFWLTYNGAGTVTVWDTFGYRRANITLTGAGTSSSSDYSFSYCNGKVFIVDSPGGTWRGYDVGSFGKVAIYGAPSTASWNSDVQSKLLGTGLFVQVDANLVSSPNPVPGLTNLQHYEAALVYSDTSFTSASNIGNALASYVTGGGGVVLATFGFLNNSFGISGNLASGDYLPFDTGGQASPGNLTMVEDLPSHVIFTGVSSFNGGTSSYQDTIAITNGGTQLAHWSNLQPLIGIKDIEPGRTVGLNFYPPSSDARSDFWVSSTSGALLMANSLLWAGKVPPMILSGPSNQVQAVGQPATFTVSAVGLPPLTYQWYRNGTNIPGATGKSFTFTVATNGAAQYSVIVSNSYGLAISDIGALDSPTHFLPFTVSAGGAFTLYLGTIDGSPITQYRASRTKFFSTANLTIPFSQWLQLTNPTILTNGQIWVQDLSVTNSQTFFQAVETP